MVRMRSLFTTILLSIFLFIQVDAQDNSYLQIVGRVEYHYKPLSGAVITLYEKSSVKETITTGTDGTFRIKLDMNSQYKVEVTKGGLITKSIEFDTEIPADAYGKWTTEFAMSLFQPCEGVDLSPLNNPVDRVKYNANRKEFVSDKGYVENMQGKIQRVMIDIENCQINKFQKLVNEGNKETKARNYEEARKNYEEALEIYPDEKSVLSKLENLDEKMKKDQNVDQLYNKTIQEADAFLAQKNYEMAKQKYEGALRLKPQETYPRTKVAEIDREMAQQSENVQKKAQGDAKYNSLITQANAAYSASNFRTAKQLYEEAALVKPNEAYPKQRIEQIKPLLQEREQAKLEKEKATREYNLAISRADRLLQEKKYEEAKQQYLAASVIKPGQSYPMQKIEEIDREAEKARRTKMEAQKAEIKRKIDQYLDEGDDYFAAKDYVNAKASYQKVLDLDPNDQYASQRIKRAESLMAQAERDKLQAQENKYNEAMAKGNAFLSSDQFDQAIVQYNTALTIKPEDASAKAKIQQAENLKAEQNRKLLAQQERDKKYQELITAGTNYMQQKNYEVAKQKFMEASNLKPGESLPQTKINEINQILAAKEQKKLKQQELDNRYNNFIQLADNYFNAKNYEQAKVQYNNALTLKPGETYPKNQLNQIQNIMLAEQRAADEQKRKQEEQERKYNEYISQADNYYRLKNYDQAKISYNNALSIKPVESYPTNQIAQINNLLAEQQRQLQAEKQQQEELNRKYNENIRTADNYFNAKNYEQAKAAYNSALNIKPGETYPRNQLTQIENLMTQQRKQEEELKAKEEQYNQYIASADNYFGKAQYELAKDNYEKALQIKPGASHPRVQLDRTNELLRKQEEERRKAQAVENKYNDLIAQANAMFNANDYDKAKAKYEEALKVKPNEEYPKERIRKILDIKRILASQQQSSKTTTTTTVKPGGKAPAYVDMKIMKESEKAKYLNSLRNKYPVGVTLEIYKEGNKTTNRYIVIRNNEVNEFLEDHYSWGGHDYFINGKPITSQYFNSQVKAREGEKYQKFNM